MNHRSTDPPDDPDEDDADRHRHLGRLGIHPDDRAYGDRIPSVDFHAPDNMTGGGVVTAEKVRGAWASSKPCAVYEALVPVEGVPSPQLAEEIGAAEHRCTDKECGEADEEGWRPECMYAGIDWNDGSGYDWSEFQMRRRSFPAPTLRRDAGGKVFILDGNHRIEWWTNREGKTYDYIPCWVVDEKARKQ